MTLAGTPQLKLQRKVTFTRVKYRFSDTGAQTKLWGGWKGQWSCGLGLNAFMEFVKEAHSIKVLSKAEIIVKSNLQTLLILTTISPKHRNLS